MMSFLQYSPRLFNECRAYGLSIAIDSGAFSVIVSEEMMERYAHFIYEHAHECVWFANADCMQDQQGSNKNYQFLLSLLPSSLHQKVLWVYQIGSPLSFLEEGLERFAMVGIGGLVHAFNQNEERAEQQLMQVARLVAQKGRMSHCFGMTRFRQLLKLNEILQGEYSCDSSTWLIGSKYGLMIRDDGVQISAKHFSFSPEDLLRQNVRTMRKWVEQPMEQPTTNHLFQAALFE